MRVSRIVLVVAAVSLGSAPAFAQRGAAHQTHGPAPQATAAHPAPAPTTHGNPHTATTPHGAPATSGKPATTTHGASATKGKPTTTTASTATTSSTTHASTTTSTPPLNPIAQKISTNHGLQPKMATLLPAGMTLDQASLGFKNQGQFIAALHVSRNLGIPFADLKTAMTGIRPVTASAPAGSKPTTSTTSTTATQPTMSLGQAIHKLRPSVDADAATSTAVHQASVDQGVTVTATATATATATSTTTTTKHGK